MITKPMKHQEVALERMKGREYYGLFMEQGTGKTWCLLADAERLYRQNAINAVLVIAPNGVHINWVRREIPQHLEVPHAAMHWKSGAGPRHLSALEKFLNAKGDGRLRILAMNIDAVITKAGFGFAERFLCTFKAMIVVDESSRIKNPTAQRTKRITQLRQLAKWARIATGTPATNSPMDVFSQMEFLKSGLLRTTSYRAFVAEYSELVPMTDPMMQHLLKRNPKFAYAQVVARDENGQRKWRNIPKLQKLLEPHTYRVRKSECMDLPPKVYQRQYFELSQAQAAAYKVMRKQCRMEVDGEIIPVQALAAGTKLQQITSGFVLHEGVAHYLSDDNPRLDALMEIIDSIDGQFIVYAKFNEEIEAIVTTLRKASISVVDYYGKTLPAARDAAIDSFQTWKTARGFVGSQQAAGIGLTLTAASTVIYYSNTFNLEHRLQSEDRCHRKGTDHSVLYIDLLAEDTIDEVIVNALASKTNMAAAIVGDLRNHE